MLAIEVDPVTAAAAPPGVRLSESSTLAQLLSVRGLVGAGVAEGTQARVPTDASRPAVLVVDDDVELLATLRDMLLPTGCRIVTAVDGADGLARFAQDDFAVLVTDLAMPKLNGLQLAQRCRDLNPSIPVVMVTAWDVLLRDEDLETYGIVAVLTKPVTSLSLREAVRQAIGRA